MAAIVVKNTIEADDTTPTVPMKPDGSPFRFEMLYNGLAERAYSDSASDLLDCLIRGYATLAPTERLAARLSHAVRSQTTVQADINWNHENLVDCTPEEQVVLGASRATPPDVSEWSSEVPLVLVDMFYEPLGELPQPVSTIADVENPPNVWWLRVEDEYAYLLSLHQIGLLVLNQHADFMA